MALERVLEEQVTILICHQACSGCLSKLSSIRKTSTDVSSKRSCRLRRTY